MGVGFLMRMVSAALGVKEREKKRKERGGCRRTTRPDWSHHLSWDCFQNCACGEGEIFVCTQLIFLSLLLSVGVAPAKKSPKLVSTGVLFSFSPHFVWLFCCYSSSHCFRILLLIICVIGLVFCWSSVAVLAERVWCAPQYKRSGGGLWNHVVGVERGVFPPGRWAGFIGHMGVLY